MHFQVCTKKEEMTPHFGLISQLNKLVTREEFEFYLDDMIAHGYRMVVVWDGDEALGLSGVWVTTKIYSGKYMELDNVVVAESARSRGIGHKLTAFLEDLARKEGVKTMMLDAYLENEAAHKFYKNQGFRPRGYHFLKNLEGKTACD
jgi:ribosomal protein S18 acetylase RimI-like enzyme